MLAPELQERLDTYLLAWSQSPAASRVDQVEGIAINHGHEQYTGQSIADFLTAMLNDLIIFLAERPELLDTVETDELVLARKEALLSELMEVMKEMQQYWFGVLDPRYHRAARRHKELVEEYNQMLHVKYKGD